MKTPEILRNIVSKTGRQFENFKMAVLKKYGNDPGNMLVHTGVLGWVLSSLAQISAVAFNDKIPQEQKVFLIPQEIADAATNILSFYLLTQSVKSLGSKLVSTGKLSTPKIRQFIKSLNKNQELGKWDFDISKLNGFNAIEDNYKNFKQGVDVTSSIIGSVLSCNIITPLIRNQFAAQRQKSAVAQMAANKRANISYPKGITMNQYLDRIYTGSSLKI